MDLTLTILIICILKNNNCQCYCNKNRNLKLLLFLIYIHKMNPCLNTDYSYMNSINNKNSSYLHYPNQVSNNSNNVTNSNINDDIKNSFIDSAEKSLINDDIKDSFINSTEEILINNNTENLMNKKIENVSNNKDSNPINPKNNLINIINKNCNESSNYPNPCEKNHSIISNSISNTFKQLPLAEINTDISPIAKYFPLNNLIPLSDVKAKLPVLVGSTSITELFNGRITFCKPIISILHVSNEIFITNKSVLPTLHTNSNNAVLHYEGFLKTQLEYLEDVIVEKYQIKCDSKHYIMFIPFSGSKELNFIDEIINSSQLVTQDFTLDITKSKFSVDTCLEEPVKANQYINLYKTCNLTVKVECDISLYRKNIVTL